MRRSPLLAALVLVAALAAPALAARFEPSPPCSSLAADRDQSLPCERAGGSQGTSEPSTLAGERANLAGVPGPETLALLCMGLVGLAVAGTPRRGH